LSCVLTFSVTGCGGGSDSTVIQPTTDFQPTAEEKAAQAEADAARESAGQ
jgi:hypothetical protein